jgi:GMP synthase PP-ATPase subunit
VSPDEARRICVELGLMDHIDALVAAAPAPGPDLANRLVRLLTEGAHDDDHRGAA